MQEPCAQLGSMRRTRPLAPIPDSTHVLRFPRNNNDDHSMTDTLDLENHIEKYYHLQPYNETVRVLEAIFFFQS